MVVALRIEARQDQHLKAVERGQRQREQGRVEHSSDRYRPMPQVRGRDEKKLLLNGVNYSLYPL